VVHHHLEQCRCRSRGALLELAYRLRIHVVDKLVPCGLEQLPGGRIL
jgi:hypothetical protein